MLLFLTLSSFASSLLLLPNWLIELEIFVQLSKNPFTTSTIVFSAVTNSFNKFCNVFCDSIYSSSNLEFSILRLLN
uniref:Putative secreted protein n=1 Tax=Panstrongylus lignarius TaxID=156445 RepID=A0A224Y409_9HEMI